MPTRGPSTSASDKFAACSDPTRLRILHALRAGALCVADLVAILDVPQPTVSRHLGYLRRSALVDKKKSGFRRYYSLAPATTAFHRKLLDCLKASSGDVPELAHDAARAEKLKDLADGGLSQRSPTRRSDRRVSLHRRSLRKEVQNRE